jgi:hypothetical protein
MAFSIFCQWDNNFFEYKIVITEFTQENHFKNIFFEMKRINLKETKFVPGGALLQKDHNNRKV